MANGYYVFAEARINEMFLVRVANKIYAPSYVSLETVLSQSGFIPETVHQITSISTRKTRIIKTPLGVFSYRTVSPRLYFGYEIQEYGSKIACAEKAILDYLYLHPDLRTRKDYESLRIEPAELKKNIDQSKFDELLHRFNSHALNKRVFNLFRWANYA